MSRGKCNISEHHHTYDIAMDITYNTDWSITKLNAKKLLKKYLTTCLTTQILKKKLTFRLILSTMLLTAHFGIFFDTSSQNTVAVHLQNTPVLYAIYF